MSRGAREGKGYLRHGGPNVLVWFGLVFNNFVGARRELKDDKPKVDKLVNFVKLMEARFFLGRFACCSGGRRGWRRRSILARLLAGTGAGRGDPSPDSRKVAFRRGCCLRQGRRLCRVGRMTIADKRPVTSFGSVRSSDRVSTLEVQAPDSPQLSGGCW